MTVAELQARMTSREYAEWLALYRIEQEERRQHDLAGTAERKLLARKSSRK